MPHSPEQGNGWEVLREFVPAKLAEASGKQVLELVRLRKPYVGIKDFDCSNKALTSYFIDISDPEDLWPGAVNLLNDDDMSDGAEELIDVIKLAHGQVESPIPGFQDSAVVNRYDFLGYLGWHRDSQPHDSFALALMGLREYWVEDIESGYGHRLELSAGDALRLYNPPDISKRPGHRLRNIDKGISLSLVR